MRRYSRAIVTLITATALCSFGCVREEPVGPAADAMNGGNQMGAGGEMTVGGIMGGEMSSGGAMGGEIATGGALGGEMATGGAMGGEMTTGGQGTDECGSRLDCSRGFDCVDGTCVPVDYCDIDEECLEGYTCLDGACVEGTPCGGHLDCPGQACIEAVCTDPEGRQCQEEPDCGPNHQCVEGQCRLDALCPDYCQRLDACVMLPLTVEDCITDCRSELQQDEAAILEHLRCLTEATELGECNQPIYQDCLDGPGEIPCGPGVPDCPPGQMCFEGYCMGDPCAGCRPDQNCLEGRCVDGEPCGGNCGPNEECLDNICQPFAPECQMNEECPSNFCFQGACRDPAGHPCGNDNECPITFQCIQGLCAADDVCLPLCETQIECGVLNAPLEVCIQDCRAGIDGPEFEQLRECYGGAFVAGGCDPFLECLNGDQPACEDYRQCESDQNCVNGRCEADPCMASCEAHRDCAEGLALDECREECSRRPGLEKQLLTECNERHMAHLRCDRQGFEACRREQAVPCDAQDNCGQGWVCLDRLCNPQTTFYNTCEGATNARPLISTGAYYGTTVGLDNTFSPETPACGRNNAPDGVVLFQNTERAQLTFCVDTIGSAYDTVLATRPFMCDSVRGEACNDDIGNGINSSQVEFVLPPGESTAIIVDGYSDRSGNFQLNIYQGRCIGR